MLLTTLSSGALEYGTAHIVDTLIEYFLYTMWLKRKVRKELHKMPISITFFEKLMPQAP